MTTGAGHHADGADHEQHRAQRARYPGYQLAHILLAALGLELRNHRHEGLRERAFREQAPQEIRDLEGHVEGIGDRPHANYLRHEGIPQQPRDAGQEGGETGGRGVLQQRAAHRAGSLAEPSR